MHIFRGRFGQLFGLGAGPFPWEGEDRPDLGPLVTGDAPKPTGFSRQSVNQRLRGYLTTLALRRNSTQVSILASGQAKPCKTVLGAKGTTFCQSEVTRGSNLRILDPIGVIVELGVPFSPDELKAGILRKTYTPTQDQKLLADVIVYAQSQRSIQQIFRGSYDALSNVTDLWKAPIWEDLINPSGNLMKAINRTGTSIQNFTKQFPEFALELPGFMFNPTPPTSAEFWDSNGLKNYYKRGGFLLHKPIASGALPAMLAGLTWNTGYCLCEDGRTPIATFDRAAGEGFGWDVHLVINKQQATSGYGEYEIKIKPHDAPFWSEAGSFVANKLKTFVSYMCANRETIQKLNTDTLLKELCTDASLKPCTKETPGCVCTKPTTVQETAVGVANIGLAAFCARWQGAPPKETPFTPPPPPTSWTPPLWLIAVGAGLVGVVAAARR